MMKNSMKLVLITVLAGLALGCASTRDVPMTVHSDPLGAIVLMQTGYEDGTQSDWIMLGNSPMQVTRNFGTKSTTSVSLRVIKEGYFEQVKTWEIGDFLSENKEQGRVVWVPHLVESKADN